MKRIRKIWMKVAIVNVIFILLAFMVLGIIQISYAKNTILKPTYKQVLDEQLIIEDVFFEMAKLYLQDETDAATYESGLINCFSHAADIVNNLPVHNSSDTFFTYDGKTYTYVTTRSRTAVLTRGSFKNDGFIGETLYSIPEKNLNHMLPDEFNIDPLELLKSGKNIETDGIFNESIYRNQTLSTRKIGSRYKVIATNNISVWSNVSESYEQYCIFTVNDITDAYSAIATMTFNFILNGCLSAIIGSLLIAYVVYSSTKPIPKLVDVTNNMIEGKYTGEWVDYYHADEIGELALNFNTMQKKIDSHVAQLEDTAQRQQLFISGLTHEIKTPLTSMMLHTDTLLTADLTTEESKKSLKHLYEQCRWMERLSQKLLMLLTMEESLNIRPVKVHELFNDISESVEEILKKRNTPLIIECEIDVLDVDYDLMKSLLINLIDNASKASENGQEIKLRAYKKKSIYTSTSLFEVYTDIFEVCDNGRGIPKDEIDRVTDAFYMVDRSRSKKLGGSGLGLALVKRIADAHKVRLEIESELSVGTTIKVIFP